MLDEVITMIFSRWLHLYKGVEVPDVDQTLVQDGVVPRH